MDCPECGGAGSVLAPERVTRVVGPFGRISEAVARKDCPTCGGSGRVDED